MAVHTERLILPIGLDRAGIRRFVIETFLDELPGSIEEKQIYTYIVEDCENNKIRLLRRAWLNKGMDFKVNFENILFPGRKKRTRTPSHDHIINDLKLKKEHDETTYELLAEKIRRIYSSEEYEGINSALREINLPVGLLTPEEVCLTLKWLFIEQDITYWCDSGRGMLYTHLENNGLV